MENNAVTPAAPAGAQPVYTAAPVDPNAPVYTQPVYQQPVYQQVPAEPVYQQPVAAAPAPVAPVPAPPPPAPPTQDHVHYEMILVSHSPIFYWWPVWVVGFIMAALTAMQGTTFQLGEHPVRIHPGNNMGILFLGTLFLVILISNVTVRGLASALVIMGAVLLTVIFAYFGWWDDIFNWIGGLNIYLNEGAYAWFSTLMFLVWGFTTFVFDRMSYWRVRPGQMTHEHVFGASAKSYDTENMSFEKRRDDVFRHWILGLGSGDLTITAFNAGQRQELHVPNVLFVGSKVDTVQRMIAMEPTQEKDT